MFDLDERQAYTIDQFLSAYNISRGTLFRLWKRNEGPRRVCVGRRVLVLVEDAKTWAQALPEHSA